MSIQRGQDQIMRILNAMSRNFSLNSECDILRKYSSGDDLQHRRVCHSRG